MQYVTLFARIICGLCTFIFLADVCQAEKRNYTIGKQVTSATFCLLFAIHMFGFGFA